MTLDLNVLINLGIIGLLAWLVRSLYGLREDVRAIKTVLGTNGSGSGLVQEIKGLREAKHEHANHLTSLRVDVDVLRERVGTN